MDWWGGNGKCAQVGVTVILLQNDSTKIAFLHNKTRSPREKSEHEGKLSGLMQNRNTILVATFSVLQFVKVIFLELQLRQHSSCSSFVVLLRWISFSLSAKSCIPRLSGWWWNASSASSLSFSRCVINPILRNETVSFLCSNHSRLLSFISIVACHCCLCLLSPPLKISFFSSHEAFFVSARSPLSPTRCLFPPSRPQAINNKTARRAFRYSTVWHIILLHFHLASLLLTSWNCERSFFSLLSSLLSPTSSEANNGANREGRQRKRKSEENFARLQFHPTLTCD